MVKRGSRIGYLPIAVQDLDDIFDYICQDDPVAASDLLDRLDTTIGELASYPRLGTVPADLRLQQLGYRVLIVDNYLVFYVIVGDNVEIRRIIHGKQRYSFLL